MPVPGPEQLKQLNFDSEEAKKAAQEHLRELQEKQANRKEMVGVINQEEDPMDKSRKELTQGAIKVMEQKTGHSLEFSAEHYSQMQNYVGERYAMLLAKRAEEYLQTNKDEATARGIDPEAKGAAALSSIEQLGATKKVIEGDPELQKIYIAATSLKEFSRGEIPPSARFAVLEQLNALQDLQKDNQELKKLRIEVFKKWSGHEPVINDTAAKLEAKKLLREELKNKKKEIVDNLSDDDKNFAAQSGRSQEDVALLKDLGHSFKADIPGLFRGVYASPRFDIRKDGALVGALDMPRLRREWEKRVAEEKEQEIKEKVALEMGGAFAQGVTNKTTTELDAIYMSLKTDIYNEFDRKAIIKTHEGKQAIEEGERAVQEKGSISEFMRGTESKFDQLKHNLDDDRGTLIQDLHDKWGMDITPDTFARFQQDSGLDYNTFSRKRRGTLLYMLKLVAFVFQEAQKINPII